MKKILLLGGSAQQISAIKHAKRMGYYTILCDYLLDNPGQKYADEFHSISTTNNDAILQLAVKKNIDGIVAYASDPAAPTAAYVAEKMGLPTNPYKSVDLLTKKDKFREFLKEHNFYTPKAKGFNSVDQVKNGISEFTFPVIIKPVDSSGSKGVSKLDSNENLERMVEYALSYSRVGRIIVEEYVYMSGYQVAGDGFSVNGELKFRSFANDHFNQSGINPYVPISASFPYANTQDIHEKIHNEIQRLLTLLEMKTGAYNFDVRVDENANIYIMEIGPRNGGNYIPQVTKYATGVDMLDYTIKAAMGEDCSDIQMVQPNGYWSYYAIHSVKAGRLREIKINSEIEEKIIESHLIYEIGDEIPAFEGANGNIGILIMNFDSMKEMLHMMDHSEEWIEVLVT